MVQAEVHFVEGDCLDDLAVLDRALGVLDFSVVGLETGEHWVLEADIETDEVEDYVVTLVSLEGRRDGEFVVAVSIEDVDELLFLHRGQHEGSPLRVCGEVLSRYDASAAGLAVGLLVQFVQFVLLRVVGEDDDSAAVTGHDQVVPPGLGRE